MQDHTTQTVQSHQSSVLQNDFQHVREDNPYVPTWFIIVVLIAIFVVLKWFIYSQDK